MASRRTTGKAGNTTSGSGTTTGPVLNAVLIAGALAYGVALLVNHGRLSWPPNQLLASLYTVAGCLALIGPLVLARGESAEGGLGELLWMTGGLLVWVFDVVALFRGDWRSVAWVTPLSHQTMGLTILAVLLAGWRCRISWRGWSWTNVTGWVLGVFWVGMAFSSIWSTRTLGLALR
ncbi:MAG: hypothetical protein U0835_22560 [Isosphaeraceae bacterium]